MILNAYERMIARRYLLPGKGEGFIFLVAGISLVAVMLGVAALIIVMSVMNGFRAELFDKITGLNGHAVIQGPGSPSRLTGWQSVLAEAKKTPGIVSATPLIEQPLAANYQGRFEAILLRGMTYADINRNSTMTRNVVAGSLASITPGSQRAAVGVGLAQNLGLSIGSRLTVINFAGRTTPFGTVQREISYEVGAIFEIGVHDYDERFVVLPMQDAQTLLLLGDSVGMIEVTTEDADRVGEIMAPLAARVADRAVVTDWRQMNASLFEALAVERVAMFVILSIIILVAVFNILSSLIMLVRAKTRDIAILRTMGAARSALIKIFVTVGTTIGALGTLAGVVLGFIFLYFRQSVVNFVQLVTGQNLWDPSIRFLTELPSKPDPLEIVIICVMALGFSLLATLYPAIKAASTDPVQVLRYE